MLKIISCNLNGIRSANKKGFFDWLHKQKADIVCLQELRASSQQINEEKINFRNDIFYIKSAEKKGYSGVGIITKDKPKKVIYSYGDTEFDNEGRYIQLNFENFIVVSLYAPSGSSSEERQKAKFRFMESFMVHLVKLKKKKVPTIICGDWNIAHKEIDLKNWKSNQKNSGFLIEERNWMDEIFKKNFFIDAFREINKKPEQYTWWSNRGNARINNVGWRIDYQVVSSNLQKKIKSESIYTKKRFSDHAPLIMEYEI